MMTIKDTTSSEAPVFGAELAPGTAPTGAANVGEAAPEPREIPPLPGGGSWGFDEASWQWVSRDPAPSTEVPTEVQPVVKE